MTSNYANSFVPNYQSMRDKYHDYHKEGKHEVGRAGVAGRKFLGGVSEGIIGKNHSPQISAICFPSPCFLTFITLHRVELRDSNFPKAKS